MADRQDRAGGAGNPAAGDPKDAPAPIIAPEGWIIVGGFVVGAIVLTGFMAWGFGPVAGWIAGVIAGAFSLWSVWFFRDPPRRIPGPEGGRSPVVSPADGVVCAITRAFPPAELEIPFDDASRMTRVSVFMNVFNVHVNRSPVNAEVVAIRHQPGMFMNASFDKASEHNERLGLRLRLAEPVGSGGIGGGWREMACVQIAGLIARRIVCRVHEGARLKAGERFGIIRFGSRVDVYLPGGISPGVRVGDKTVAGETVLAWLEPAATRRAGAAADAGGGAENGAGAKAGADFRALIASTNVQTPTTRTGA